MKIPESWLIEASTDELLKQKVRFLTLINGTMSAGIWLAAGYLLVQAVKFIGNLI